MSSNGATHLDDVVAVEVTIDGMLVIADKLHLMEFPPALAIRNNIPQLELRNIVWEQVGRDLAAQGVLDVFGTPHPEVAAMVDTLSRADRTLEGRWWRRNLGGKMVRFVVCRKGDRHVVAARDDELLVLQRVAPQVGLAGMVNVVLGSATPVDVEPLTAPSSMLSDARTANQLGQFGINPVSARTYANLITEPTSWVELTATERHPGGTTTTTDVAAGCWIPARAASCRFRAESTASCTEAFCPGVRRISSAQSTGWWNSCPRGPGSTGPTPTPATRTEKGTPFVDDYPPRDDDDDHDDDPTSSRLWPSTRPSSRTRRTSMRSTEYAPADDGGRGRRRRADDDDYFGAADEAAASTTNRRCRSSP